jgi:hypothetical protein
MGKPDSQLSELEKKRKMRNCRKKRKRQQRAINKRSASEAVLTQKIHECVMEHRALADKYYIKWKNVCKEANDLRRKIPIKSHSRQVNYFERGKYNNSTK